ILQGPAKITKWGALATRDHDLLSHAQLLRGKNFILFALARARLQVAASMTEFSTLLRRTTRRCRI
ncbi:MAG: hypothetical protein P8N43_06290, partial [Alphaproteobacteria bacterium]|nr:hypothetical protein [Alphaproteobacteria bacterium]